uniref:Uncharacterized protein n=1 Tax=Glossina pallidipes TaxID=7398 RepID=A0A1B0ACT6_GLOPL
MNNTTVKRALDWGPMNQVPTKRRRRNRYGKADNVSHCGAAGLSRISSTQLSQSIRDEVNRLHRCKQLPSSMRAVERIQDSNSDSSDMNVEWQPQRPDSPEEVLFTFKDVQLICERVLKEREYAMRAPCTI